jgi:hypothetical protein
MENNAAAEDSRGKTVLSRYDNENVNGKSKPSEETSKVTVGILKPAEEGLKEL